MTALRDTLRPSVLVGLGKYGLFTAKKVMDAMTARHPASATIMRAIGLDEGGRLWRLGGNDATVYSIPNVRPAMFPGVWHDNVGKIESERIELTRVVEEELTTVSDLTPILELREKGYQVEDGLDIFLFSSLFEPVGSVAIVPMLRIIGDIDAHKLSGTFVNISCFFFFPDLFREYEREDIAYARSYATIQELDALLDRTSMPVEYIWMFSSRNEENRFVASYNDVVGVITENIHLFTTRSILADTSFSAVLLRKVKGKTSRYSALGSSTFLFPMRESMLRLEHDVGMEAVRTLMLEKDERWDAREMALEVRAFLHESGLQDLDRAFGLDEHDRPIWEPFSYAPPGTDPSAEVLLSDLGAQADAFRRDRLLKAQGAVLSRKRSLLKGASERFQKALDERLSGSPDMLRHTLAWMDELLNWDTPTLQGESGKDAINLGKQLDAVRERMRLLLEKARGVADAEAEGASTDEGDVRETAAERKAVELALDDADPARRRSRIESYVRSLESEQADAAEKLKAADALYRPAQEKADRLEARRRGFFATFVVAIPIVLVLLLGGGGYLLLKSVPALKTKWLYLLQIGVGALALYGGVVWAKIWKDLRTEHEASARERDSLRAERDALKRQVLEGASLPLTLRYERDLLESERGFLEDFIQHVARARRHLNDFINHLLAYGREAEEERRRILLPNTPFMRSAVSWEEVDRWVARHPRFRLEARSFFKDHPLSEYYHGFTQTSSLARLRAHIQEMTESLFGYLRGMSLEEILFEMGLLPDGPAVARLKGCFDQAKAFISVDAEDVMDESATLIFALMSRSKYGFFEDILTNHSITEPSFYYTGDPHSLVVYRLKAGFPAFLMTPTRLCRAALNRLPDRPMYFTDPLGRLPSVYPTVYTVGDVDDEIRQIVALGQAFGFLQEFNGGWWMNGQKLADTFEDLGEYLRRMAAAPVREDMKRMVHLYKKEPGAITKLSTFLRSHAVEHVDQSIIESAIRELSPLE